KRTELGADEVIAIVPFEDLTGAITKIHQDPKDIPPADVGRSVKADLVLVGDIQTCETRLAGQVGMASGRAKVGLRVVDVARPEKDLLRSTVSVTYPP